MKVISRVTKDCGGFSLVAGQSYDVHKIIVGGFSSSVQLTDYKRKGRVGIGCRHFDLNSYWFHSEDGGAVIYLEAISGKAVDVFWKNKLFIYDITQNGGIEMVECRVVGVDVKQPAGYMQNFPKSDFKHLPMSR